MYFKLNDLCEMFFFWMCPIGVPNRKSLFGLGLCHLLYWRHRPYAIIHIFLYFERYLTFPIEPSRMNRVKLNQFMAYFIFSINARTHWSGFEMSVSCVTYSHFRILTVSFFLIPFLLNCSKSKANDFRLHDEKLQKLMSNHALRKVDL